MKKMKLFLLLVPLLSGLNACYFEGSWGAGISGNGDVNDEVRDLDGFTGIHVSSGIDVFLSQGDDYHVKVVADENLLEIIKTEVKGRILEVGVEHPGIRRAESKRVYVTMPELDRLKISSAGDCTGETTFECGDLDIDISSAGDLRIEVYADRIKLNISSSGDANIKGETDEFDASLSSAGDLEAFDLKAKNATIDVSSAGDARVYATEELRMTASSAGNIYYRGGAKVVRAHSSSAGDIIERN